MPLNQGNLISSRGELEVSTGVMSRLQSGWAVDVLGRRGLNVVTEAPASATRIAGRAFDAAGRHYATTASGTVMRGGIRYSAGGAMLVTGAAPTANSRIVRDEYGAFLVSADGAVHVYGAERMTIDGSAGNYASTPDATALDITGDIDIRVRVALPSYTPAAVNPFVGKWNAPTNDRSYLFYINPNGTLEINISSTGGAGQITTSNDTVSASANQIISFRVALDVDDGAGNRVGYFYTSSDGVTWTPLGTPVTVAGTLSIYNGAAPLVLGASNNGSALPTTGLFYSAQVYNGIDGTLVADFNPNDYESGTTFVSRTTGETWTLNGTAAIAIGN